MTHMLCFENVKYDIDVKIKILSSKKIIDIKKFFIISKNGDISRNMVVTLDDDKKYNVNGRLPNYFKNGCMVNVLCSGDDIYQIYDIKLGKLYVVGSEVIEIGYSDSIFNNVDVGMKKTFGEIIYSIMMITNIKNVRFDNKYKTIIKFDNNNENFIVLDNVIGNFNICDVVDVIYKEVLVDGIINIFICKIYNHNSGKLYVYNDIL